MCIHPFLTTTAVAWGIVWGEQIQHNMASLSDFVFTLPADDDDNATTSHANASSGSAVIRREDDEDASDRAASFRARNNRSSKSSLTAAAATSSSSSSSSSSLLSRGTKRGRNDVSAINSNNDDSDGDDNDGEETEKLSGAFEFEDVMTPATGTWAAQLFNRTGIYHYHYHYH